MSVAPVPDGGPMSRRHHYWPTFGPDLMPPDLRKAHQTLDRAVDRLYRRGGFASERERVEHLFMLYEKILSPLTGSARSKRRRRQ